MPCSISETRRGLARQRKVRGGVDQGRASWRPLGAHCMRGAVSKTRAKVARPARGLALPSQGESPRGPWQSARKLQALRLLTVGGVLNRLGRADVCSVGGSPGWRGAPRGPPRQPHFRVPVCRRRRHLPTEQRPRRDVQHPRDGHPARRPPGQHRGAALELILFECGFVAEPCVGDSARGGRGGGEGRAFAYQLDRAAASL